MWSSAFGPFRENGPPTPWLPSLESSIHSEDELKKMPSPPPLPNTVRSSRYSVTPLPTTKAEQYKAKQAIDTFFVRAGDVISAGIVFVGGAFQLSLKGFGIANVIFVLIWLGIAVLLFRENRAATARKEAEESADEAA